MKCGLCENASDDNRYDCFSAGWRAIEVYGPRGNKYICACPSHTPAQILENVKNLVEDASPAKGSKRA